LYKAGMTDYAERSIIPIAYGLESDHFKNLHSATNSRQLWRKSAKPSRKQMINHSGNARHIVLHEVLQTTADHLHESLGVSRC